MVKCPYCGEEIEDDSCYCDQCGGLLYVCPRCKKIGRGKGKRCGACGSALVASVEQVTQDPVQGSNSNSNFTSNSNSNTNGSTPPPFNPANSGSSSNNFRGSQSQHENPSNDLGSQGGCVTTDYPVVPTALEYAPMGIRLQLSPGHVIGRTQGPYSSQLGQCIYISGTHARVDFDGRKWTITDLGSRNGTKVNGQKCTPTLTFIVGDIVRLGNFYDFKVI